MRGDRPSVRLPRRIVPSSVSDPIGGASFLRMACTPAMTVVLTAPSPTRRMPSLPDAGAMSIGLFTAGDHISPPLPPSASAHRLPSVRARPASRRSITTSREPATDRACRWLTPSPTRPCSDSTAPTAPWPRACDPVQRGGSIGTALRRRQHAALDAAVETAAHREVLDRLPVELRPEPSRAWCSSSSSPWSLQSWARPERAAAHLIWRQLPVETAHGQPADSAAS